jgi:DNA-binding protein H-NS
MNLAKYNSLELRELRKEIDRELKKRRKQEVKEAQKELKTVAERYGFSLTELLSAAPGGKTEAGKGTVRYRHPEDAGKTWSGRGRKPSWVKEWEGAGRSLDDLRVA